jgi:hypothetical protein
MSSAEFVEWAKAAFEEEIRCGFSRASTFDGILATSVLKAIRAQPRERLSMLSALLPLGAGFHYPGYELKRSQLSQEEALALESYLADLRQIEQDSSVALMHERAACNWFVSAEYRARLKQAKREFARTALALSKELGAELHFCGADERGLVFNWDRGRMHIYLGLTREIEFEYMAGFMSHDGARRLDNCDYLMALGLYRGSWSLTTGQDLLQTLRTGCEFMKWHIGEYQRLILT